MPREDLKLGLCLKVTEKGVQHGNSCFSIKCSIWPKSFCRDATNHGGFAFVGQARQHLTEGRDILLPETVKSKFKRYSVKRIWKVWAQWTNSVSWVDGNCLPRSLEGHSSSLNHGMGHAPAHINLKPQVGQVGIKIQPSTLAYIVCSAFWSNKLTASSCWVGFAWVPFDRACRATITLSK